MLYILCALEAEVPSLRLPTNTRLVFTGVGKVNAAYVATKSVLRPDCAAILNYGTAGTLNTKFAQQFLSVARIRQRDIDARPLMEIGNTPFETGPTQGEIILQETGVTLSTGDNFVKSPPIVQSDIVDMEAYAIAKVCMREAVPFTCVKYVTDLANEDASADWQSNVAAGQTAFQSYLDKLEVI